MTALAQQESKSNQILQLSLTGNPLVDNGLAVVAALADCSSIEDLTLDKAIAVHEDGNKLARNNIRLKSTYMVFVNSYTMQSKMKDYDKKYADISTALLNSISKETKHQSCDFCGNPRSVNLTGLIRKHVDSKAKQSEIGRNWFPLAGSIGNDAQSLPGGSRGLNGCAKCLFAVQYLPQAAILVNGLLTIFQSTSLPLWYQWVRSLTFEIRDKLAAKDNDKIENIGRGVPSREVSERLLKVMERYTRAGFSIANAYMIMYLFSNMGDSPSIRRQLIPDFALNFLRDAVIKDLGDDALGLIGAESNKIGYEYSFLNCISKGRDYRPLYPSGKWQGATPGLYLLYQTDVLGYPAAVLHTAYNIATYLKAHTTKDVIANLERDPRKQNRVRKYVIEMVGKGLVSFNDYYDLMIRDPTDSRNPWMLIKYYSLNEREVIFNSVIGNDEIYSKEYRDKVIAAATRIFSLFVEEYGIERLKRLLTKFTARKIGNSWLRLWFEKAGIDYRNEELDYRMVELFRVLFTSWALI